MVGLPAHPGFKRVPFSLRRLNERPGLRPCRQRLASVRSSTGPKNRYEGHPASLTTEGQFGALRGHSFGAEEFAEHRVHLHRLFLLDLLVRPEDDTYGKQ